MRVACVQLRSGGDVGANVAAAEALIRKAAEEGADLVATPEMTHLLVRGRDALLENMREEGEDDGLARFRALAGELGIHILIGSLAVREGTALRNRSFLLGPDGDVVARYDKMHMFDATVSSADTWRESATYRAGATPVTAEVGDVKLGMSVCYDLRFPELYRFYARAGCHLLSVPAACPVGTVKAAGTLGGAVARAGHRERGLRGRTRARRAPPGRAGDLWPFGDRRAVGRGAGKA